MFLLVVILDAKIILEMILKFLYKQIIYVE